MDTMQLVDGYDRRKNPASGTYRAMTLDEGKALGYGDHVAFRAYDGTARKAKVNGRPKTWKRSPERCEIPCKYGLYECATFCWNTNAQAYIAGYRSNVILVVAVNGDE